MGWKHILEQYVYIVDEVELYYIGVYDNRWDETMYVYKWLRNVSPLLLHPQVRTLPALEPRSPSKKRPLTQKFETTTGFGPVLRGERKDTPSPQPNKGLTNVSPTKPSTAKASGSGGSVNSIDSAAVTAAVAAAHSGTSGVGTVQETAPCLPLLTKGPIRSVLASSPPRGFAPSSGLGGELDSIERGNEGEKKWRDRQHAWVGGGRGEEGGEGEEFPFLVEDDVLVDDRFEVRAVCGRSGTPWAHTSPGFLCGYESC